MATEENYEAYRHQTIWDEIKGGSGRESQHSAYWGWYLLQGRLGSIRSYVDAAVAGVAASREGVAADAATGAVSPLGAWIDQAAELAGQTAGKIAEQNTAYATTDNEMPEVVPVREDGGWREYPVVDSFTTSDQEREEVAATEAERRARNLMTGYQDGTNARLGTLPRFHPPAPADGGVDIPTGQHPDVGGIGGGNVGVGPGGGSAGGEGGAGSVTRFSGAVMAPAASYQPPATTGTQGYEAPAAAVGGGEQAGGRSGLGGGAAGPGTPGFEGGPGGYGRPRNTAGTDGHGRSGGVGGRTGSGYGSSGRFGGAFGTGGGGRVAFGPGAGGAGRPAGFGPQPQAATGPTPSGAAGAGGRSSGVIPMGAIGAGRGRGGEDTERKRPSYLVVDDPHAIIGKLEPTLPAGGVIGEDPRQDSGQDRRR